MMWSNRNRMLHNTSSTTSASSMRTAMPNTSFMTRASSDPAVEPGQRALHRVRAMTGFAHRMPFAGIVHQLHRNSERQERLVELLGLGDGRACVVVAHDDQRGRLDASDVGDG